MLLGASSIAELSLAEDFAIDVSIPVSMGGLPPKKSKSTIIKRENFSEQIKALLIPKEIIKEPIISNEPIKEIAATIRRDYEKESQELQLAIEENKQKIRELQDIEDEEILYLLNVML